MRIGLMCCSCDVHDQQAMVAVLKAIWAACKHPPQFRDLATGILSTLVKSNEKVVPTLVFGVDRVKYRAFRQTEETIPFDLPTSWTKCSGHMFCELNYAVIQRPRTVLTPTADQIPEGKSISKIRPRSHVSKGTS